MQEREHHFPFARSSKPQSFAYFMKKAAGTLNSWNELLYGPNIFYFFYEIILIEDIYLLKHLLNASSQDEP